MAEIFIGCQYGERRNRAGKRVKAPSCSNRASGIFRIHYFKGKPKVMFLCADCGFDKMPNHVKIVMPNEDAPKDAHPIYFHDVANVELVASLNSDFDQGTVRKADGYKWWVERSEPPLPEPIVQRAPLKRIVSHKPKMDLEAYRNSLKRHDDGK
jgi:hypothetical protein